LALTFCCSRAVAASAPVGSTTSFIRSQIQNMVLASSASFTVSMSST